MYFCDFLSYCVLRSKLENTNPTTGEVFGLMMYVNNGGSVSQGPWGAGCVLG